MRVARHAQARYGAPARVQALPRPAGRPAHPLPIVSRGAETVAQPPVQTFSAKIKLDIMSAKHKSRIDTQLHSRIRLFRERERERKSKALLGECCF